MSDWNGTAWVETRDPTQPRESLVARLGATAVMLIAVLLLILPSAAVSAAPSASSVWIESPSGVRLATNGVHYGDGFRVGYSTSERKPWAHIVCYSNASTTFGMTYSDGSIWGMYYSVYAGGPQPQAFVAGQSVDGNWSSGGADCRVDLLRYSSNYSRSTILASSTFTVAS
jgi:hypothetical protein